MSSKSFQPHLVSVPRTSSRSVRWWMGGAVLLMALPAIVLFGYRFSVLKQELRNTWKTNLPEFHSARTVLQENKQEMVDSFKEAGTLLSPLQETLESEQAAATIVANRLAEDLSSPVPLPLPSSDSPVEEALPSQEPSP